jgi:hypothetical protein
LVWLKAQGCAERSRWNLNANGRLNQSGSPLRTKKETMTQFETSPDVQYPPFVLTPRTLAELRKLEGVSSPQLDRAWSLLSEACNTVFVPFLTQTRQELLQFEFERLSYAYFPYRIQAIGLVVSALGLQEFQARYLSALMRMAKTFANEAPQWGIDPAHIEALFRRYLASALRLVSMANSGTALPVGQFSDILIAVTKADFGLTAIFLAMEKSVLAEKWVLQETVRLTDAALGQYEQLVSQLWQMLAKQSPVFSSLEIDGDIEEGLRKLGAQLSAIEGQRPQ